MNNSIKELLERSTSLLKKNKLQIKPLERVLHESSDLLTKLNRKSTSSKNLMGQSLLVQEGFNVGDYVSSLKEINLENLSKLSEPTKEMSLKNFLQKEETYTMYSCIQQCKNITNEFFYETINKSLFVNWINEKKKGVIIGTDTIAEEKFYKLKEEQAKIYSSIILSFFEEKKKKLIFSKFLENGTKRNEVIEIYYFLEDINKNLLVFLQEQYKRYIDRTVSQKIFPNLEFTENHKHTILNNMSLKTMLFIQYLERKKYIINSSKLESNKWKILYFLKRTGIKDDKFTQKYFKENINNRLNGTYTHNQSEVEEVKKELYSFSTGDKQDNRIYEIIMKVLIYKIKDFKVNFNSNNLRIEDYLWFKSYLDTPVYELKTIVEKCGIEYFNSSNFLYFKLLLLVRTFKDAIEHYQEKCKYDHLNFLHWNILLYQQSWGITKSQIKMRITKGKQLGVLKSKKSLQDKNEEKEIEETLSRVNRRQNKNVYKLIKEYAITLIKKFNMKKDALLYIFLIKDFNVKTNILKELFVNFFFKNVNSKELFNRDEILETLHFLKEIVSVNNEELQYLFMDLSDAFYLKGEVFKGIEILFFSYEHKVIHTDDLKIKFLTKVLQFITEVLYNFLTNYNFENNNNKANFDEKDYFNTKLIIQYSGKFIELSKKHHTVVNEKIYQEFTTFIKLFKFFKSNNKSIMSVKELDLLPFDHDEINTKTNLYNNSSHRVREQYHKLIKTTHNLLDNNQNTKKEIVDSLRRVTDIFCSRIQSDFPQSFHSTVSVQKY